MNPLPVSTKRLENCTVQLRDASLVNCALLPLFDARGVAAKVVLLSARTRECWVLDWRQDLVYVPLVRAVRVDMARATSQRATAGELLWLYDPRGLIALGIASLCGGTVAGNAAEVLPKTVTALTWRRDLSRIANVWTGKKHGENQLGRWKPEWLADASPQPAAVASGLPTTAASPQPQAEASARPARGWVLDPIWMR